MTWRAKVAVALAAIGALLCWSALALQFYLLVGQIEAAGGTLLLAAWRFLGYFTILTNLLVAAVLTRAALQRGRPEANGGAKIELTAASAIVMVGLVYSFLLRATWSPQGVQKLADMLLHDVAPILYVLYFLLRPRRRFRFRDGFAAMIFPLLYVVYAVARGSIDGWYAYWFLDPRNLSGMQMTQNIVALAAAWLAMSVFLIFVSNAVASRTSSNL